MPFPTVYCWTMNTRLICLGDPFQSPLSVLTADFTNLMSQHLHLFPNAKWRLIPLPLEMLVSPPLAVCVAALLSAHTKRQLFHRQQSRIQRPAGPVVWSSKFQITALWMNHFEWRLWERKEGQHPSPAQILTLSLLSLLFLQLGKWTNTIRGGGGGRLRLNACFCDLLLLHKWREGNEGEIHS